MCLRSAPGRTGGLLKGNQGSIPRRQLWPDKGRRRRGYLALVRGSRTVLGSHGPLRGRAASIKNLDLRAAKARSCRAPFLEEPCPVRQTGVTYSVRNVECVCRYSLLSHLTRKVAMVTRPDRFFPMTTKNLFTNQADFQHAFSIRRRFVG